MTPRRKARTIAALLCTIVAFVLVPALCLYIDECYPQRDPRCPYCNFIVTYVAVIALAAPIFVLVSLRTGVVRCQRTAPWSCSEHIGLPFVRGPPLTPPLDPAC